MNSNAKFTSGLFNKSPLPIEIAEIAKWQYTVANVKPVLNLPSPVDGPKTFERVKEE
jgi:hypothetical protein